jgi:hypothetical protein
MIFKDEKTGFEITEKEINESICRLVTFLNTNKDSKQAAKIKKKLEALELAVAMGQFKN